jgi:glutathione synthase
MGCYLRLPAEDHRTNLAQGAQAERATLSHQEIALAHTIGAFCQTEGAEFIGIDMVYPYIIEINIVNPGGLGTLQGLGIDLPADRLIQQIVPR